VTDTQTPPSGATLTTAATDFAVDAQRLSMGESVRTYFQRFKTGGELGLFPAILALLVLTTVFGLLRPNSFLSLFNFGNYFTQAAPICVLAMGVTFVLLIGEIDLAAGYTAGVCAALMASQLRGDAPLVIALFFAFAAAIAIGLLTGWLVSKVGIPSFIVTLSFFLAWQGWLLLITKEGGTIRVENDVIVAIENRNMPVWLGWALWAVLTFGYLATALYRQQTRARKSLAGEPMTMVLVKAGAIAVIWGIVTALLNSPRGANGIQGVPIAVPLVIGIAVVLSFVLTRTAWGRHLYAVGGNVEAARRAGIEVDRIKISAFVCTSVLACIAGIFLASRLNSVDPQTGGNDTLLIAIGAAVIGGTSLFGGRGRIVNAVVGGMVFALINNGLPLLREIGGIDFSAAGPKFMVNGIVLLLFASLDAVSRRRSAAG
jgi:D-xylose transport system permease protein